MAGCKCDHWCNFFKVKKLVKMMSCPGTTVSCYVKFRSPLDLVDEKWFQQIKNFKRKYLSCQLTFDLAALRSRTPGPCIEHQPQLYTIPCFMVHALKNHAKKPSTPYILLSRFSNNNLITSRRLSLIEVWVLQFQTCFLAMVSSLNLL